MSPASRMIPLPAPVTATVALEPVYNILMSMVALHDPQKYSGLDEWVTATNAQLPTAVRARHQFLLQFLWLDALSNAVARGPATADFPSYLAALRAQSAVELRDRLLYWTIHSAHGDVHYDSRLVEPPRPTALLADIANYRAYLAARLGEVPADAPLRAMYALWTDPPTLQQTLVDHLQTIWARALAPEWARIAPRLQATVTAFQQLPLQGLTMLAAMQTITGRDLQQFFRIEALLAYRRVRFIPHIHSGPYIIVFGDHDELRVGFPAHQPADAAVNNAPIDFATLVNRTKALADETRLALLWALRNGGELSTQAIIDRFDLDKSAASRHLRQLVATSLVTEQRVDGARKVYTLNPAAVDELIRLLQALT